jgi:LacI family sucrose operon transcriptional repressor
MSQHHLLQSDIHIASFDDHYLYDSLTLSIDTVEQNIPRLAYDCFDLITQLIEGNEPTEQQRILPATLRLRNERLKNAAPGQAG